MIEMYILVAFILFFIFSIIFIFVRLLKKRDNQLLPLIIFLGLILRCYTASDRYLHTWDEKFHAVVSKNIIKHPLEPMLYQNPVLPYNPENWVENHVWLEKGPIPLFLISLSLRVFGINEYAVRLPSLLLSLLAIYLTFLIGQRLFNKRIALLAAFFHSINGLIIEVGAGRVSSDHVETLYIVLVEVIFLLIIISHNNKKNLLYPLLIGGFSGLAFLTKWTPVLMIFPIWIILEFFFKTKKTGRIILHTSIAILTFLVFSAPWVVYILMKFPVEAKHVLLKFVLAFNQSVELHKGPFYYYFLNVTMVFGELIWLPLIIGITNSIRKNDWRLTLLSLWWLIPFVFFSFAATKRHTYLLIAAPAIFLLLSYTIFYIAKLYYSRNKILTSIIISLLVLLPIRYCIERVKPFKNNFSEPTWVNDIKSLKGKYPENTVFFNCEHAIEGMFYTDYVFYTRYPTKSEEDDLAKRGYKIVIY